MVADISRAQGGSLRQVLKARTRALHDGLDAAVGPSVLGSDADYAAFLGVQYAARAPIERWAEANLSPDIRPPQTAALIADDLARLGRGIPAEECFALPPGADPRGLAWALGGSALGNKSMLVQLRRAGRTDGIRFLSDPATAEYFRRVLPIFEQPVSGAEADTAVAGAEAVFRTFLAAASRHVLMVAA